MLVTCSKLFGNNWNYDTKPTLCINTRMNEGQFTRVTGIPARGLVILRIELNKNGFGLIYEFEENESIHETTFLPRSKWWRRLHHSMLTYKNDDEPQSESEDEFDEDFITKVDEFSQDHINNLITLLKSSKKVILLPKAYRIKLRLLLSDDPTKSPHRFGYLVIKISNNVTSFTEINEFFQYLEKYNLCININRNKTVNSIQLENSEELSEILLYLIKHAFTEEYQILHQIR